MRTGEARPEYDYAPFPEAQRIVVGANTRAFLMACEAVIGRSLQPDDVESMTWEVAELARRYTATDYAGAITRIHLVGRVVARFFEHHDIILTPTMRAPPPPLGVVSPENPGRSAYIAAIDRAIGFTSLFNSAMSVPLHWTASGLPVGVQFAASFGDEATLLRLAAQLEVAKPWRERLPPLIV